MVAPAQPGPMAGRPAAGPIRDRILDAAAGCLVEGGFASTRLLSAIARRAEVSRPTLYKHGGTLDEIKAALLQRETAMFIRLVEPRIRRTDWDVDQIVELLVFVIGHGRRHPLLQAALRDVPEVVLPWFTVRAETVTAMAAAVATPIVAEKVALPPSDVAVVVDMLTRIVLSFVFTASHVDADDAEALRTYLRTHLGLVVASITGSPLSR